MIELHDALLGLGFLTQDELERQASWPGFLDALAGERRAACLVHRAPDGPGRVTTAKSRTGERRMWVAAERLPQFCAVYPDSIRAPQIDPPAEFTAPAGFEEMKLPNMDALLGGKAPFSKPAASPK